MLYLTGSILCCITSLTEAIRLPATYTSIQQATTSGGNTSGNIELGSDSRLASLPGEDVRLGSASSSIPIDSVDIPGPPAVLKNTYLTCRFGDIPNQFKIEDKKIQEEYPISATAVYMSTLKTLILLAYRGHDGTVPSSIFIFPQYQTAVVELVGTDTLGGAQMGNRFPPWGLFLGLTELSKKHPIPSIS